MQRVQVMPLLRLTTDNETLRLHGASTPLIPSLRRAITSDPGPVTIMVHGYKYLPGDPRHCPHQTILSPRPLGIGGRVVSWPRHLGFRGQCGEGLGISFGWPARGSIWQAWQKAEIAGDRLAELVTLLRRIAPARDIHLVAHSLGARVSLRALTMSAPGAIARTILLAAAEFEETARAALRSAGPCAQILNVTSRENDLFDFLVERVITPPRTGDRVLGHGGVSHRGLATLQLDDGASLDALRGAGFPIAPPRARVCHWSPYLRPGVFPLYRAFLQGRTDVHRLRVLLPQTAAPRWSRLLPGTARLAARNRAVPEI